MVIDIDHRLRRARRMGIPPAKAMRDRQAAAGSGNTRAVKIPS
jgi:hypothetical protein